MLLGGLLLLLGSFIQRQSRIALGLALALGVADGLLLLALSLQHNSFPPFPAIILRVGFASYLYRGFRAIHGLQSEEGSR